MQHKITLHYLHGAIVDAYSDELQNFKGMFFQDEVMKNCLNSYPFIDATYKLLDINTPVYVMLVEDSNGQSEIVFICILVHEDHDSVKWMMDTFKNRNSSWQRIRVVMGLTKIWMNAKSLKKLFLLPQH